MNLEKPIKRYMKDTLFVTLNNTMGEVADALSENKKDVAVVRDKEGVIHGIVTSHDLFDAMVTWLLQKDMLEQIPTDLRDLKISSVMKGTYTKEFMEACGLTGTNVCITLGEEEPVKNAVRVMAITGLDHIIITGEDGIAGTLSDDDLIEAFQD